MNNFKSISALIFALIICANTSAQNNEYFTHTVNKGQTLYSIAKMYGTDAQSIMDLNYCDTILSIGEQLIIPQRKNITNKNNEENFIYHTISPKETIYSLCSKYNVKVDDVRAVNPGLNVSKIYEGDVIRIPINTKKENTATAGNNKTEKPSKTHKVQKRETIRSISRMFKITTDELIAANPELKNRKLIIGEIITIPTHQETKKQDAQSNGGYKTSELEETNKNKYRFIDFIFPNKPKVAIILPFLLDKNRPKGQLGMVEFYEGLLLSIKEQKDNGNSYEITTFDSGDSNRSLDSLIKSGALDDMNIIIGAGYKKHNKELAAFAKEKGIHLVIPFTDIEDEIYDNPMVYVVNTNKSYLTPDITEQFSKIFPNVNPIFISDANNNQKEVTDALKRDFENRSIEYHTISIEKFTDLDTYTETIRQLTKKDKLNVIIPCSKDVGILSRILPIIVSVRSLEENPIENICLFGYPEWQEAASSIGENLYKADTFIFTTSFCHNSMRNVSELNNKYYLWFNRNMQDHYPRYAILGYDIGNYFLSAISTKGKMPEGLDKSDYAPIQTDFKFERVNNWGGYINKKVFLIHFTPDFDIEKIDFDRLNL